MLLQSHISENPKEIEYVLEMNPCCTCYSDVYDKCGMFDQKVSYNNSKKL